MNTEHEPYESQLERATSADPLVDEKLDEETARLREGWLALASLLEEAEAESQEPFRLVQKPWEKRRSFQHWRLVGVLAGSVVLFMIVWNSLGSSPGPDAKPSGREMSAVEKTAPAKVLVTEKIQDLAWDDALDESFARVAYQVIRVRHGWTTSTMDCDLLEFRVKQLQNEINHNTL